MNKILTLVVVLALLIGSSALFFTRMIPAAAEGGESESFSPELAEQVAESHQQKQSLTTVQRKIDSRIIEVVREVKERISSARPGETPKLQDLSTPLLKIDDAGNIEVKLTVTSLTAEQLEQLEALGMNIRLTLPKYGVIEGSLSYDQIEAVAALDFVVNVGTPGYALHNTGDVTSEGDTVLGAAEARAGFGVDGSGIKVGAISDGVSHLTDSVATGDLPSSPAVDVLKAGDGDEGTAMLEIIHDLAAGAPLAFYAPDTSSDMVAGIAALEAAGCEVIVDDLTWSDEPKFEDGPIAQEASAFYTDGGVYVTSAGNSAQRHYMATYVRTAGPGGGYDYAHDYGGGDVGNTFTVPNGGYVVILLQWNNQWGYSGDDFDLVLYRSSDQAVLALSDNWQEGDGYYPWEGFSWTNDTGSAVTVFIAVLEYSLVNPPSSLILDYHVWYGSGLQYVTPENSVIGHSAVEEVLSTAAADAATPDTIEDFSSRGPGTVYFPSQEDRQVPNITGVDGVQTKTGQLGYFYNPFYGTSASAPHVAAIAALVWEADPTLTPSQVHNAITSTAVDLGPAGYDYTWGFGRADAYEAVASVAGEPDITVSPTSFDVTLAPDTTQDYTLTIGNDGGADLTYDITDQEATIGQSQIIIESTPTVEPGIDACGNEAVDKSRSQMLVPQSVGEVIKSFAAPGTGPLGLAWDGEYLWNADWETGMIYKLSLSTGSVVQSFSSPGGRPFGLTYDGTYLWVTSRDSDMIYQLDPATGSVIRSIPSPGTDPEPQGLTWDGEYLWVAEYYSNKIYKLDPSDGSIIQSFDWIGTYPAGLAWDGTYLWHCDLDFDTIYKLNPTDGSVITSFSSPGDWPAGLNWDGQYIWHSDAGVDIIYQIDVGAQQDCSWLDEEPKSGTVGAGSSDSITVTVDTTGLAEGSYSAEIVIASNDPDEASTTVPVTLQVSPTELPTVVSASPNSGEQGATLEVTIGGTNFAGATAVSFGDGITVNSFTVVSATQITADISISATATLGARNISVTTPDGTGTLTSGFTVVVAGLVTVSIDAPAEAAPDSDFTANVNISEVVGFDACNYDVTFDPLVLQLDDVTSGLIDSTAIPVDMYNEISSGTYRVIQNVPGLTGVSGSGYLAVLHFHVIGSQGDSSTISLSNGMLSDNLAEEIAATWVGDSVDITSVVPGDANGDGNVNALDITKVERIIAGLDAETSGADANQDGNVNALDITKIELIIAGLG